MQSGTVRLAVLEVNSMAADAGYLLWRFRYHGREHSVSIPLGEGISI